VCIGFAVAMRSCAAFNAVDDCLDRSGSFNYSERVCDFDSSTPSHPYQPAWYDGLSAMLVGVGTMGIGFLLWSSSRGSKGHAP
jgi:hypothetical protein